MTGPDQPLQRTQSPEPLAAEGTEDLDDFMVAEHFPATRDTLLAALSRSHAPAHLSWQIGRLSPHRTYADVDEVHSALSSGCQSLPLEPI